MATTVYVVVNNFRVVTDESDSIEIIGISLSREGAEMILEKNIRGLRGAWTDGDNVFEVFGNDDLEYDTYYIDEHEATE